MITYFQAIILGLLQGISELFPVSSLGHSVLLPSLLGWPIHQSDEFFLTFLIATHLATALVLLGFFWKDWSRIVSGIIRSLADREIKDADAKLGWLLIVGTIPAGIIGLLFEEQIRKIFITPLSAAIFLTLNGFILLGAEYLRRRAKPVGGGSSSERISHLSYSQTLGIGSAQALALIPGLSRSGAAMAGGLLTGMSHEDSAHYAFLLATPIIFAAAALKVPDLFTPANHALLGPAIVGAVCSAITAYLAVKFLTKYFETNSLTPFGIYCLITGSVVFVVLLVR